MADKTFDAFKSEVGGALIGTTERTTVEFKKQFAEIRREDI
jgi:hypothetical protein